MSEAQPQEPFLAIEKVYVKDLSVEVPNAPKVFLEQQAPQVELNISNSAEPISEGYYHVLTTITVTAKAGERTVFLVEAKQGGVFQIRNIPPSDLEAVLAVACPNILFPYLRETVSDAIVRAGFPPYFVPPVNFERFYQQRQQAAAAATPPAAPH